MISRLEPKAKAPSSANTPGPDSKSRMITSISLQEGSLLVSGRAERGPGPGARRTGLGAAGPGLSFGRGFRRIGCAMAATPTVPAACAIMMIMPHSARTEDEDFDGAAERCDSESESVLSRKSRARLQEPASDSERRGRYGGGREANLNLDGPSIGRLGGSCQCQFERRCRCLITGHLVTQTPSLTVTGEESDCIRGEGLQDVAIAITSSRSYAPFRSCHRANKAV